MINRSNNLINETLNSDRSSRNSNSNIQEQYNQALVDIMTKINTGGGGIGYYHGDDPEKSSGYADKDYWDVKGYFNFQIKPGKKPSEAIIAFMRGPTTADCGNAVEFCKTYALLKVLGAEKFDAIFSDPSRPLVITPFINGHTDGKENAATYFFKSEDLKGNGAGEIGDRPIKKGEMCQIWNVPYYSIKHPGSFSRLYNVICTGKNSEGKDGFMGLGATNHGRPMTEDDFIKMFAEYYNSGRCSMDMAVINKDPDRYDMAKKNVKETLSLEDARKDVIGFMPDLVVRPAYRNIKKYQDMPVDQVAKQFAHDFANRFSSYENDDTIDSEVETAAPPAAAETNSTPETDATSETNSHSDDNSLPVGAPPEEADSELNSAPEEASTPEIDSAPEIDSEEDSASEEYRDSDRDEELDTDSTPEWNPTPVRPTNNYDANSNAYNNAREEGHRVRNFFGRIFHRHGDNNESSGRGYANGNDQPEEHHHHFRNPFHRHH